MLIVEESRMCYQCDEVKQVVSFNDTDTCKEETICENCLDKLIAEKIVIIDPNTV